MKFKYLALISFFWINCQAMEKTEVSHIEYIKPMLIMSKQERDRWGNGKIQNGRNKPIVQARAINVIARNFLELLNNKTISIQNSKEIEKILKWCKPIIYNAREIVDRDNCLLLVDTIREIILNSNCAPDLRDYILTEFQKKNLHHECDNTKAPAQLQINEDSSLVLKSQQPFSNNDHTAITAQISFSPNQNNAPPPLLKRDDAPPPAPPPLLERDDAPPPAPPPLLERDDAPPPAPPPLPERDDAPPPAPPPIPERDDAPPPAPPPIPERDDAPPPAPPPIPERDDAPPPMPVCVVASQPKPAPTQSLAELIENPPHLKSPEDTGNKSPEDTGNKSPAASWRDQVTSRRGAHAYSDNEDTNEDTGDWQEKDVVDEVIKDKSLELRGEITENVKNNIHSSITILNVPANYPEFQKRMKALLTHLIQNQNQTLHTLNLSHNPIPEIIPLLKELIQLNGLKKLIITNTQIDNSQFKEILLSIEQIQNTSQYTSFELHLCHNPYISYMPELKNITDQKRIIIFISGTKIDMEAIRNNDPKPTDKIKLFCEGCLKSINYTKDHKNDGEKEQN